jgi:hypothetical protein
MQQQVSDLVQAHSMAHCIGEDSPKQADGARCGTAAAAHARKPAPLGLEACGGLAFGKARTKLMG